MATVTNTIKLPDGSAPAFASVEIRLIASVEVATSSAGWVSASDITVLSVSRPAVTAGVWSTSLAPNASIDPAGTVYQVIEHVGRDRYVHYILVPTDGGNLHDLLTDPPTTVTSTGLAAHQSATTSVHGIADTSALLDTADIGVSVQGYSAVLAATTASFTTADETKLDAIEPGATGDQTAAEILAALLTVDGAGSGLDADLLDGNSSAAFATAGHNHSGTYDPAGTAATAVAAHEADTTAVHGIANTSTLYRAGGTDVAVVDGGTGASTALAARANLEVQRSAHMVDARDYFASGEVIGDDNTAAIAAAAAAAFPTGATVYLAPGSWVYNGAGLAGPAGDYTPIYIQGAGRSATTVVLGSTSYLVKRSNAVGDITISGLTTQGGRGAVRLEHSDTNVNPRYIIDDCRFRLYTMAAISHEASDMPYWYIDRCQFEAANHTSTIGIALSGLTDDSAITNCAFFENRVHVKLRRGGNNARLWNCSFLRYNAYVSTPRTDVWFVPNAEIINSGEGFTCGSSKFGPELRDPSDYMILFADEGSGSGIHDKFPVLTSDSTGYIVGLAFSDNAYGSAGAGGGSIIHSTTPNVRSCSLSGLLYNTPDALITFRSTPPIDYAADTNTFGPFLNPYSGLYINPAPSVGTVGVVVDPAGQIADPGFALQHTGGADGIGYLPLLTGSIADTGTLSDATRSAVTDAVGGSDAAEITFSADYGAIYLSGSDGYVAGRPVWLEFDMAVGSSSPIDVVQVYVTEFDSGASVNRYHLARAVRPAATWARLRIPFTPRSKPGTGYAVQFVRNPGTTGTKVKIGRVRLYQAIEPAASPLISATLPAASFAYRGQTMTKEAAGVEDVTVRCVRSSGGTYKWINVVDGTTVT